MYVVALYQSVVALYVCVCMFALGHTHFFGPQQYVCTADCTAHEPAHQHHPSQPNPTQDPQTFDTSTVSRLPFDWHLPPQAFKRRRSNLHHPSQGMQSHMTQQSGEGVPPGEGIPETTEETPQGAYEDVPPDVVHGDINIAMPVRMCLM